MKLEYSFKVEGGDFTNAGVASSNVKKALKQLNISPKKIRKIVVSLYEAEVNIVAHAYKGDIFVSIYEDKIETELKDEGPGIPNIEKAMQIGFSTASAKVREMGFGAGMGLPNMKKNSDKMEISSEVGKGTTVKLTHYF